MGEFKTEVLIPVASEADVAAAGVIVDAVAREDTSDGGGGGVGGGGGGGSVNLQGVLQG